MIKNSSWFDKIVVAVEGVAALGLAFEIGGSYGSITTRESREHMQMSTGYSVTHRAKNGEEYHISCNNTGFRPDCRLTVPGDYTEYKPMLLSVLDNFIKRNEKAEIHPKSNSVEEIKKIRKKFAEDFVGKHFTIYRNNWLYQELSLHDVKNSKCWQTEAIIHYGCEDHEIFAVSFWTSLDGKLVSIWIQEDYHQDCDKEECWEPGYKGMKPASEALEARLDLDMARIRENNDGFPKKLENK